MFNPILKFSNLKTNISEWIKQKYEKHIDINKQMNKNFKYRSKFLLQGNLKSYPLIEFLFWGTNLLTFPSNIGITIAMNISELVQSNGEGLHFGAFTLDSSKTCSLFLSHHKKFVSFLVSIIL